MSAKSEDNGSTGTSENGRTAEPRGTVDQLVEKAGEMKDRVSGAQAEIAAIEKSGEAAGGLVSATCDGTGKLRSIRIDPSLMDGEAAVLEELIVNAVEAARERVQDEAGQKVSEMLGGLPLPASITRMIAQFTPISASR